MKHTIGEICEAQAKLNRHDRLTEKDRIIIDDCIRNMLELMMKKMGA